MALNIAPGLGYGHIMTGLQDHSWEMFVFLVLKIVLQIYQNDVKWNSSDIVTFYQRTENGCQYLKHTSKMGSLPNVAFFY